MSRIDRSLQRGEGVLHEMRPSGYPVSWLAFAVYVLVAAAVTLETAHFAYGYLRDQYRPRSVRLIGPFIQADLAGTRRRGVLALNPAVLGALGLFELHRVARRRCRRYVVTNRRILVERGVFFGRRVVTLDRIGDASGAIALGRGLAVIGTRERRRVDLPDVSVSERDALSNALVVACGLRAQDAARQRARFRHPPDAQRRGERRAATASRPPGRSAGASGG